MIVNTNLVGLYLDTIYLYIVYIYLFLLIGKQGFLSKLNINKT